jgi:hypothetical protein
MFTVSTIIKAILKYCDYNFNTIRILIHVTIFYYRNKIYFLIWVLFLLQRLRWQVLGTDIYKESNHIAGEEMLLLQVRA